MIKTSAFALLFISAVCFNTVAYSAQKYDQTCEGQTIRLEKNGNNYFLAIQGDTEETSYTNEHVPENSPPIAIIRQRCMKLAALKAYPLNDSCDGSIEFTSLPGGTYQIIVNSTHGQGWMVQDVVNNTSPQINEIRAFCDRFQKLEPTLEDIATATDSLKTVEVEATPKIKSSKKPRSNVSR